jgi:hypothetical protein
MCFFPELAFSFFLFSPSPFHSATSPVHTATVNSTCPQFPNLRNGADGDCQRAPQEWQYGTCRGCQRAPQEWSGQSALGWTGGMKHTWADRGSRNGSVQLTKPHLPESARDTFFFVLFSSSQEHPVASFCLETGSSPLVETGSSPLEA